MGTLGVTKAKEIDFLFKNFFLSFKIQFFFISRATPGTPASTVYRKLKKILVSGPNLQVYAKLPISLHFASVILELSKFA